MDACLCESQLCGLVANLCEVKYLSHVMCSFLGPIFRVDLIKLVSNIRTSLRPQKFLGFNDIWYVGTGRRVMHDGMQYDQIQGEGHEPLKVGNSAIFDGYLLPHLQWGLANDHGFLN